MFPDAQNHGTEYLPRAHRCLSPAAPRGPNPGAELRTDEPSVPRGVVVSRVLLPLSLPCAPLWLLYAYRLICTSAGRPAPFTGFSDFLFLGTRWAWGERVLLLGHSHLSGSKGLGCLVGRVWVHPATPLRLDVGHLPR